MAATASFSFDDGIATSSWNAMFAFRRRGSMSAIGSGIVTRLPSSPRSLHDTGHLAGVRHVPQAHAAESEVAVHRARPAAPLAARIRPHLELRCLALLVDESLLGHSSPLPIAPEREPECTQ